MKVKLYDHAIVLSLYHYMITYLLFIVVCMFVWLPVALWTILYLMPTTSHSKAIGGVC